jgi:hypothetical protein
MMACMNDDETDLVAPGSDIEPVADMAPLALAAG